MHEHMRVRSLLLGLLSIIAAVLVCCGQSKVRIVITGSTGTIGASLADRAVVSLKYGTSSVVLSHRDAGKLRNMLKRLESVQQSNDLDAVGITPLYCNLNQREDALLDADRGINSISEQITSLVEGMMSSAGSFEHIVLFNNAAVCPESSCSDKAVLRDALRINAIFPTLLTKELVASATIRGKNVTVVNISSGDGELAYLHPSIQDALSRVNTLDEWEHLVFHELDQMAVGLEYATGPTPAYCLSKAALNCAVRINRWIYTSDEQPHGNSRVIAVCPGDVASSMSTDEELCSKNPHQRSARQAARDLYEIALNEETVRSCPSGGFYRYGKRIKW